jgi:hypothetical protein
MSVHFGDNTSHLDSIDRWAEVRVKRETDIVIDGVHKNKAVLVIADEYGPAETELGIAARIRTIMLDKRHAQRIIMSIVYMVFALACFIVAVQNYNAPARGWFSPVRWLILDSVLVFTTWVLTVIYMLRDRYRVRNFIILASLAIDSIMATTGGIVLWSNNPHSQPRGVHDIMTAALVIKFCGMVFTVCYYRSIVE